MNPVPHPFRGSPRRVVGAARVLVAVAVLVALAPLGSTPAGAATLPGPPKIGTTIAGNGQATVTWTKPASDGGSPINGFRVTPFIGAVAQPRITRVSTATSFVMTGLTNSQTYTFKVAVHTAAGWGWPSAASAPIIVGAPGRPSSVTILPGPAITDGLGPLTVRAPRPPDNGSAITAFTATCTSTNGGVAGSLTTAAGAGDPSLTVVGLTTGKSYRCNLAASNARGTGVASPLATLVVGVPSAPSIWSITNVTPGTVSIWFFLGANNGSTITANIITCRSSDGGVTVTKVGGREQPISGLTVGKLYQCSVLSHNARGNGPVALTDQIIA